MIFTVSWTRQTRLLREVFRAADTSISECVDPLVDIAPHLGIDAPTLKSDIIDLVDDRLLKCDAVKGFTCIMITERGVACVLTHMLFAVDNE